MDVRLLHLNGRSVVRLDKTTEIFAVKIFECTKFTRTHIKSVHADPLTPARRSGSSSDIQRRHDTTHARPMHDAPEYKHSSSSSSREQHHQLGRAPLPNAAGTAGARITPTTSTHISSAVSKTSTSSMESIGHRIHRLEKRLEEENNSHNHLMFVTDPPSGSTTRVGDRDVHMSLPIGKTKRPNLGCKYFRQQKQISNIYV